jgi:hypothetical protein
MAKKKRKKRGPLPALKQLVIANNGVPALMQEWAPPAQLEPITAEVYAALRMIIDSGCAVVDAYRKFRDGGGEDGGGWSEPPTGAAKMAETIYRYVPAADISLVPAQDFALKYKPGEPVWYPDTDASRLGWPTFVDRPQLLAALQKATPETVQKEIGSLDRPPDAKGKYGILPSADVGGLEWWAIALAAGGVLAWLGRRSLPGLLLGVLPQGTLAFVARWLFRGLVVVGGAVALTHFGKKLIEEGAKKAGALVPFLVLGGVAALGIGVAVSRAKKPRSRELQDERR